MFVAGELVETCRKAARADVAVAGDGELCQAAADLAVARAALDAAEAHVLVELEHRGICEREFGLSTASWVAQQTHAPRGAVAGRLRVACRLRRDLEVVDDALSDGTIAFEHARAIVDAANPRIEVEIAARQEPLVDHAQHAPFNVWRADLGSLAELLDQDGGYDPDRDLARNTLRLTPLGPDHLKITGELVGEAALVVKEAVEREADRLFHAERTDLPGDLTPQRRPTLLALGLAELCRRAEGVDLESSRGPGVDVTLVITADRPDELHTVDGETLVAGRYRHLTCDPAIHALVVDALGVPLDLGREQRYANRAQRRALAHRDGGCVFPGCDAPVGWCDAHHVIEWEAGGPTDLPNLALLCRYHHGITHRHGWTMAATHDQQFTWTTPLGRSLHSQRHRGRHDGGRL
jgi:hypothetical protein